MAEKRIFPNPEPGKGISAVEKELKPLFAAVAKAAKKVEVDYAAREYYLNCLRVALDGKIPEIQKGIYCNVGGKN